MYLEKSKRTEIKEVIKPSRSKLMALQLTNSCPVRLVDKR